MYATLQASKDLVASSRAMRNGAGRETRVGTGLDLLCDHICAEAGVWAPDVAGRAVAQAGGDLARAVTLVRVWAATLPGQAALGCGDEEIRVVRRVSAAFAEIPGGQWLGASPDFETRLLDWSDDDPAPTEPGMNASELLPDVRAAADADPAGAPSRAELGRVASFLRAQPGIGIAARTEPSDGPDPFDEPLGPRPSREARLAALARGETGALVALANVALIGRSEAVAGELCVGAASLRVPHPRSGAPVRVAEVPLSEATVLGDAEVDGATGFQPGFGVSVGRIERRALAGAVIDATLETGSPVGGMDELRLLGAVDGLATSGFVDHLRLPHFASFASYLDRVRPGAATT